MNKTKQKLRRERVITYAEDLKCRQYRVGTKEVCGQPVEYYEIGIGDVCGEHKRTEKAIRYAKKPKAQEVAA